MAAKSMLFNLITVAVAKLMADHYTLGVMVIPANRPPFGLKLLIVVTTL